MFALKMNSLAVCTLWEFFLFLSHCSFKRSFIQLLLRNFYNNIQLSSASHYFVVEILFYFYLKWKYFRLYQLVGQLAFAFAKTVLRIVCGLGENSQTILVLYIFIETKENCDENRTDLLLCFSLHLFFPLCMLCAFFSLSIFWLRQIHRMDYCTNNTIITDL